MLKTLFQICIIFIHLAYTQGQTVYNKQSPNPSRTDQQQYVYHTNGSLWMGWDNYGNTGDQTCSAIIPGWVYPGGSGLQYNCRAGYWIIAKVGSEFFEGTTGEYVLTRGTEPGATSQGWAGGDYNKEPWVSNSTWYIPSAGLTVKAERRSWSYPGSNNYFFRIGDFDFNDFVIEEITITNTGGTDIDELVLGSKADHDCAWNVPNPDWDYAFWTDDIVDYDEESFLTMQLDGDEPGSASNDFGIDDPNRQYRGVRVGQAPLNIAGTNYSSLSQSDVNHMWWTGDEDPQTAAARYNMATRVSSGGDKKDANPPAMDMRYLQSYSVGALAAGDSTTFVIAVLAGAGLENVKQAVFNARKAYDWDYNLPKPPSAPQMTSDAVEVLSDGSVKVSWSYSDAQIAAVDPDKGVADFAGFRIYRSVESESWDATALYDVEGLTPDPEAAIEEGTPYPGSPVGPFSLIAEGPASDFGSGGVYSYTDENTQDFIRHWYYIAAFDEAGSDPVHGDVASLESYYTMCYPMVLSPYGEYLIPGINLEGVVPFKSDEYSVLPETISGTLTLAESPYYVLYDVETSGQVAIEPGVEIIFINGSLSGSFNAQGSETDSIRFYNMSSDQTNGVIINTENSTFSHCVFDLNVRSNSGSLSVAHSGSFTISADNTALDISYSEPTLYAMYCTGNITNNTFDYFSSYNYCNNMLFENNVFKNLMISSESNNITFKRNLFLGNSYPYEWGRMLWLIRDTSVTIINNTFSEFDMAAGFDQSSPSHIIGIMDMGESLDIDIRNNIFWNISDTTNACVISNPYSSNSNIIIEYNNIQGGADEVYGEHFWGSGNINEDPLFTDSEDGDFTLQLGSPSIDAGDPNSPLDSDGTRADMGAFELTQIITVHSGDTDNNGVVDEFDVLPIGIYFLNTGPSTDSISYAWEPRISSVWDQIAAGYADTNGDGIVDERDVVGIGVNWGNTHELTTSTFSIDLGDSLLIRSHIDEFRKIYNSLSGNSDPIVAIKTLLEKIIGLEVPIEFSLQQNYPNPFNSQTNITFNLPEPASVTIEIYNLLGQVIYSPVSNKPFKTGTHIITIDNSSLSSGIYFYSINAEKWKATRKMLLLK